jgi:hypothetical protein
MEHSKNFEKVKNYYLNKLWNKKRVYNAVGKWITAEEYEEITGEPYVTATDTNVGDK